jgi:hypothetical protein
MKPWFPFLASMLCASAAFAEPPAPTAQAASSLVREQLVAPLTRVREKRKAFSRAAPVARQMRVRILDEAPNTDARGKQFLRFAIDERLAWVEDDGWTEGTLQGCAYPEEGKVYVRQGEAYVPSRGALGKPAKADPHACRAAPQAGTLARASAPERI